MIEQSELPRSVRYMLCAAALAAFAALAARAEADGPAQHQARQQRPVLLGVSGGSAVDADGRFCCGGTLGGLLEDCNGKQYVLSNNHVLGRTNRAAAGEDTLQPALIESRCRGNSADAIADFSELILIDFDGENVVDAAIAETRPALVDPTGAVRDIGVPSTQTVDPSLGMTVQKSGRTTGHTTGQVVAVDVSVLVSYPKKCGGGSGPAALMTDQFRISDGSFSAGGDSGSLIFDVSTPPRAVGLLFAGSSTSTIANRIENVLGAPWSIGPLAMAGGIPDQCGGCTTDDACNDGDSCTVDTCSTEGRCISQPVVCDDGDACTADRCLGGACTAEPVSCDDGDACTTDTCDPTSGCVNVQDPQCADPCGDAVCDIAAGESCRSCPDDCAGRTNGKPTDRFCCGVDADCSDPRCQAQATCKQGTVAGAEPHARSVAHAANVKRRHSTRLLELPDVIGHGVGLDADGRAVIEVYLAGRAATELPNSLDGLPVRGIVTGRFEAY